MVAMYNTDLLGGSSTLSAIAENGDRYDVNSLNISDISENPKLISVTINENTNVPFVNINDEQSSTTSTYSSNKIENLISGLNGVGGSSNSNIDDESISTTSTYSSSKINNLITAVEGKMLTVQSGTSDLTAGVSELSSGTIYCVYE